MPGYWRIAPPAGTPSYALPGTVLTPGLTAPTSDPAPTTGYFFPSYSKSLPDMLEDAISPDDDEAEPEATPAPAQTGDDPTAAESIDPDYWFPTYSEKLREMFEELFEEE
jgi:hypothetical protein